MAETAQPNAQSSGFFGTIAIARVLLALAASWLFLRSAWLSDDAFISLRQVEMFVTGKGMVWNLGERVQAFTHPTWFFLLSFGRLISGSLFYMTIVASALCVAGALWLYWRECRRFGHPAVVLVPLMALPLLSVPLRDFMTSGLENPLSFLLIAGVFSLLPGLDKRSTRRLLWVVLALAVLNRQDLALQLGPLALWLLFRENVLKEITVAAPGILLLVAWFAFATFYFGAPLPNTYFAKLSAGIPQGNLYGLGAEYFKVNLLHYPFSSAVILLAIIIGFLKGSISRLLALGLLVHLFYLFRIGGDFMLGRFLSADFLIACFIIASYRTEAIKLHAIKLWVAVALALSLEQAWLVPTKLVSTSFDFVADERQFYYHSYGLFSPDRSWPVREPEDNIEKDVTYVAMTCGFIGSARIRWPDSIFLVDSCGLTNPFLSRLPVAVSDAPKLRTGHFNRTVPANYGAVELGLDDWLNDTESRALWHDVRLVARAPLFDKERLAAVWRLATRQHEFSFDNWSNPENAGYEVIGVSRWLTPMPEKNYPIYPSPEHKQLMEAIFPDSEGL